MPEASTLLNLIGELEYEVDVLRELAAKNAKSLERLRAGVPEEYDHAALGYSIHNLYNAFENYALRIAKCFENHLDPGAWHRELVKRMTMEIPQVRPRVWSPEVARHVDELRRFRHAFRHIYDSGLDPAKLMLAQDHVRPAVEGVLESHERFLLMLQSLISELEA